MATRSCPECGAQYVATVRRCIDCEVVLVDDPQGNGSSAAPVGAGDQVGYELVGWGNQLKVTLEGMMDQAGIGRVWEAGALVVSAEHEAQVDQLIATVEGGDLPELDDDVARVALEIEGLDAEGQAELDARLIAGSVPYAWDDEAALVVAETDEEQVLEMIGEILDAQDDGDAADGLAARDALSALFVAVDRLHKKPDDAKQVAAYLDAAEGLDTLVLPYGFSNDEWGDLLAECRHLVGLVRPRIDDEDEGGDDEDDADEAEGEQDAQTDLPAEVDAAEGGDDGSDDEDGDGDGDEAGSESADTVPAVAKALRDHLVDFV